MEWVFARKGYNDLFVRIVRFKLELIFADGAVFF